MNWGSRSGPQAKGQGHAVTSQLLPCARKTLAQCFADVSKNPKIFIKRAERGAGQTTKEGVTKLVGEGGGKRKMGPKHFASRVESCRGQAPVLKAHAPGPYWAKALSVNSFHSLALLWYSVESLRAKADFSNSVRQVPIPSTLQAAPMRHHRERKPKP